MVSEEVKEILEKKHYKVVGNHSAVQICRWTKKALRDEGFCFKQQFYGIKSHLCCQMTPSVVWCQNKCLHCWRETELTQGDKITDKLNSPKEIIDGAISAQKKLLEGFKILPETKHKTVSKVNMKKWEEAQEPMHFSISLSGEPTIYPYIGELIQEIRKRGKTSFLVTNGLYPEKIQELANKNQLPTQLTVSVNSPNKEAYIPFHKSSKKNAWEKLNKTLEIISKLKSRTVVRINFIRGLNMDEKSIKEFSELIKRANPKFVHIKAFMSVGAARKRLGYNKMPDEKEMQEIVNKICEQTGLKLLDKHERSRAYVLGKNKEDMKIKKEEI